MELTFLNRYYGHAGIIRRYARLPAAVPLPFTIQHGLYLPGVIWQDSAELHAVPSAIWAWSTTSAASFGRFHDRVFAGAAPFVYLADTMRSEISCYDRRGTLVFPPHGTPHVRLRFELAQYLDEVTSLPAEFHPLTACLHPTDIGTPVEAFFHARGITVVSNGPATSDKFADTFISHAARARYATAPAMGTAIAYCAYVGTRVFLLGPKVQVHNVTDRHIRTGALTLGREPGELGSELTLERVHDEDAQRAMADEALGATHKLTPAQVREQFEAAYRHPNVRRLARLGTTKLARRLATLTGGQR